MSRSIVKNLPHVQGNRLESIALLTEGLRKREEGVMGKEKFWMSLNLPGCPDLGIVDKGDD